MTDSAQVLEGLGIIGPESDTTEPEPAAAEPTATSTTGSTSPQETSDDEEISLDDALAELDGEPAPDQTAAPATDADPAEAVPDDVAEMRRRLDEFEAREAEAKAQAADAAFDARWDTHIENGYAFYDNERARIQQVGIQQGRTADEIELAIYRRVVQGIGLPDGALGEQEWERQTLIERVAATRAHVSNKTAPSQLDQLVSQYGLDDTDRTALAKFINYPPEHLKALAETLGAKNQRLTQTQQTVRDAAVANVRSRLTQQAAPGAPGAAPRARRLAAPTNAAESRQLTEYVARSMGMVGPTG